MLVILNPTRGQGTQAGVSRTEAERQQKNELQDTFIHSLRLFSK